jgi:hypothetical protein
MAQAESDFRIFPDRPYRFSRRRQDDVAQPHPERRPRPARRLLVNDFGAINVDADLVVGIGNNGDVISLKPGSYQIIHDRLMKPSDQENFVCAGGVT